jgi:putative endonuclease
MQKPAFVYIMTNINNTVLYTGVTSDLLKRVSEHKNGRYPKSFTSRYNCHKLVWYECFGDIGLAIEREKQIKGGNRQQKLNLVNGINAEWKDLYDGLF